MIKFIDEEKGYRFISSLTGKEYAILDLVNLGGTGSSGLIAIADPKNEKRDGGPEILGYLTSNYTSKDDESFLDDLDHFFSSYIESIEKEQSSSEDVGPADNIVNFKDIEKQTDEPMYDWYCYDADTGKVMSVYGADAENAANLANHLKKWAIIDVYDEKHVFVRRFKYE